MSNAALRLHSPLRSASNRSPAARSIILAPAFAPTIFTPHFLRTPPSRTAVTRSLKMTSSPPRTAAPLPRPPPTASEFVLLGSGVSTALPRISCVLRGRLREGAEPAVPDSYDACPVCQDGLKNPLSPNRRGNVCALVRVGGKTCLIDCGKSIRESVMRHMPGLGIMTVDAIVLTHGHADAIMGLDEVRDMQIGEGYIDSSQPDTPVFLSAKTMDDVKSCFSYLVPDTQAEILADGDIQRRVSKIEWNIFKYREAFQPLPGVKFTPVPLEHGGNYIAAGFVIEIEDTCVAYLSDVNKVPDETMEMLEALERIDLLVIDSLHPSIPYRSHMCLTEAMDLARKLQPAVTRCVGMSCSFGDHNDVNKRLKAMKQDEGLDFRLGYDGERFPL